MQRNIHAAALALLVALSGCSTSGGSDSVVGAFASPDRGADRPIASAIVDAMGGGLVGNSLGDELGRQERRAALEAEYRALEYTPVGETVAWGDRGDEGYGEVKAGSPYRVGSQDCRQYAHTLTLSGQPRELRGTACRNADGSWTPLI